MLSSDADNLYWMSRYLERAEQTARVIDVNLILMLDEPPAFVEQRWARLLAGLNVPRPEGSLDANTIANTLTFDRTTRSSIVASITAARDNAREVRELISSEMWEQINRLYLHVSRARVDDTWGGQMHELLSSVKEGIHLFQGITDATMMRGEGRDFMELGRFIERAVRTAGLVDTHFAAYFSNGNGRSPNEYLDWVGLLKSRTAFEAYCQVYTADLRPDRIAEFLLLNAEFPQTVHFSIRRLEAALDEIGHATGVRRAETLTRTAARLRSQLEFAQIDEILATDIHAYLTHIQNQCGHLHSLIQQTYIAPPIESILSG
jgi:uncharacterized alpha-E superfamily protein